jgi:hypothetical protein
MAAQDRELWACIKFGPLSVDFSASGAGYSPDLAHDLLKRTQEAFLAALKTAAELDVWPDAQGDDDVDVEVDDSE